MPAAIALLIVGAALPAGITDGSVAGQASTTEPVPPSPDVTLSITDLNVIEGAAGAESSATFTLSLSAPIGQPASVSAVTANRTAVAGSDFTGTGPRTVTFPAGEVRRTVTVAVAGDSVAEGNETFVLDLLSPVGVVLADAQGQATILDEEGSPTLSVNDVAVVEGPPGSTASAAFTVSLSAPPAEAVTVSATSANGTAAAGSDFVGLARTAFRFAPGQTTTTLKIAIVGDSVAEGDETFTLHLKLRVGAVIADDQAQGTVLDDDGILPPLAPPPSLSISNAIVVEGAAGATATATFAVTLSAPAPLAVTVAAASRDGTATAGPDYFLMLGSLVFGPGESSKVLTVSVAGDSSAEGNESFVIDLAAPTGATLADSQGVATILDEEGPPAVSVDDVTVVEGGPGVTTDAIFTVSLSAPASQAVSVLAGTGDGSASAGPDYAALVATRFTFAPGETVKQVAVSVVGDAVPEIDETFRLDLSVSPGAVAVDPRAVATISGQKLTWAPPVLMAPTAITIDSDVIKARGPNGHKWLLDNAKDYEIRIGKVETSYGVVISGGRHVVIMGGHITIPWAGTYPTSAAAAKDMAKRRALLVAGQTGIVHIEGILVDNSAGDLSEGIQIQAPNATVQIENVRITDVHARDQVGYTDNHPDCLQPLGVRTLRVDRFSCSSDAQAFYLDNGDGALGGADIRRTNVWGTINNYPYLFHRVQRDQTYPLALSNVWVKPQPGDRLAHSVANVLFQGGVYQDKYPTVISGDGTTASWPGDPTVNGVIKGPTAPGGDFVPADSVGLNYRSPGYLP